MAYLLALLALAQLAGLWVLLQEVRSVKVMVQGEIDRCLAPANNDLPPMAAPPAAPPPKATLENML